ncbi:sulfite exporter TauE/SafE family protein [Pontibacter rufus]|uniref:sulfite exporter TauE/SafE family protein n=1 Tax=Pontibacter rufus TaxID=2791028 RepID=UPI001E61548B|nr:sulfite exporter TauE/SafE family protein [Pontibacter sp. 172403-2]
MNWKVTRYYVPAAVAGVVAGGLLFSNIRAEWLQIFIGMFLLSTVFQYRFGKKERSFSMKLFYFVPLGFLIAFFSTLVGAMGPVLNPFYLNYGVDKESMIGTKTANSFLVGLVQIGTYTTLGALHGNLWLYGLALGAGASIGNYFGKRFLQKISSETFRKLVLIVMVISGAVIIYDQLKELLTS